jgi:hypothetical protein
MGRGASLMKTQDILQQYEGLRRTMPEAKLPVLEKQTYQLDVKTERLAALEQVYAKLDRFNPVSGWMGYQSGNQHFINQPLELKSDYGVLLNAEMVNAHNTSLHVRYDGNGQWLVTQYNYREGGDYLADRVQHIASFDKDGKTTLDYLRFWTLEGLGVNPVFACFVGFGGKEQ